MQQGVTYKGFTITPRPLLLASGRWNTEVRLQRGANVKPFYASNTWESEDEAVKYCLEYGRRVIDGEIPEFSISDLP